MADTLVRGLPSVAEIDGERDKGALHVIDPEERIFDRAVECERGAIVRMIAPGDVRQRTDRKLKTASAAVLHR